MDRPKACSMMLPLVEGFSRVSDALVQADLYSTDAVVSTNGMSFWLHSRAELLDAAQNDTSQTLSYFQLNEVPVLDRARLRELGTDLTALTTKQVDQYFPAPYVDLVVTSVVNNVLGDRMVVTLANPNGTFKIVSKVWVCPKDREERYRSPGICPVHGNVLQQET